MVKNGFGWNIEVKDEQNIINDRVIIQLKNFDSAIYLNRLIEDHFILYIENENICFTVIKVDIESNYLLLKAKEV